MQDLGRPGLAHLGVPTAGAADRRAFGLANRLVGNRPDAAALEITLAGPELELEAGGWVALTGGRVAAEAGRPAGAHGHGRPGRARGRCCGSARCPAGCGPTWPCGAGSTSRRCWAAARPTPWPRSARRGCEEGTRLPVGDQADGDPYRQVAPTPAVDPEPVLRTVRGPRDDVFTDDALRP